MQVVFPFQFTGDLLAAPMLELVIQRSAVFVHPQANDVDMVAVDVVFIDQIRLVAIAQFRIYSLAMSESWLVQKARLPGAGLWKYAVSASWWIADGHLHFKAAHTLADAEMPVLA